MGKNGTSSTVPGLEAKPAIHDWKSETMALSISIPTRGLAPDTCQNLNTHSTEACMSLAFPSSTLSPIMAQQQKALVLLLKTKSVPGDAYEELFTSPPDGAAYDVSFVPVLKHQFEEAGLAKVRDALETGSINGNGGSAYGGLIFTSQRAVEAFAKLVEERRGMGPLVSSNTG